TAVAAAPAATAVPAPAANPALMSPASATEKAPDVYKAKFSTTKGDFVIEVHRAWAPNGADRFYNLVKLGYYDNCKFFRVIDGFMAQTGINGDPVVQAKWRDANIPDDAYAGQSNKRAMVTFATGGPNTRTTQFFINFKDNSFLDASGFPPFGQIVEGESVIDQLYRGYGEGAPNGSGPDQGQIQMRGNAYLAEQYPNLDTIKTAKIVP
ncbi:MAG: peptidylprolyl isomerase, partial [Elusimicrobiota bacterium]